MLNDIRENRIQRDGMYILTLQMPEEDYFNAYESLSKDAAAEILTNYLNYHQDDGRVDNIKINYNKNGHVVNITTDLHYLENDHTDVKRIPDMLNITRRNGKQ